jgi:hydroxymethylglutaryl-CoA reductase (NADPH)
MRSIRGLSDQLAELAAAGGPAALAPRLDHPVCGDLAWDPVPSARGIAARWRLLGEPAGAMAALADDPAPYAASIESFIGTVRVPVGIAGPLRICGAAARGDFYIPLATTEAALVASVHRGAAAISEAGGCAAMVVDEGMTRTPVIELACLRDALAFVAWALEELPAFHEIANATTRHGRVRDIRFTLDGRRVHLHVELITGDAAGHNMASFAAEAVLVDILARSPVTPTAHLHEGNLAGEKRATAVSLQHVRGRKVIVEAILPRGVVESRLGASPAALVRAYRLGAAGATLSGAVGRHAQLANPLAALFLACGQDLACVAEATGTTELDETADGSLVATVMLPSLAVGVIGGGTGLPTQHACLEILGSPSARALAEICGATCLAAELSVIAALATGTFADAHRTLGRARRRTP